MTTADGSSSATAPVASAPLQGTVGGESFVGTVALAHYSVKSAVAEILVFNVPQTCADYSKKRDGWHVQVAVRWQAGVSGSVGDLAQREGSPVGTSSTDVVSTLFVHTTGTATHLGWSHDGRVEVLEAGTEKGSHGRLRVRATSDEGHHVEGEMPVEICTVYADR